MKEQRRLAAIVVGRRRRILAADGAGRERHARPHGTPRRDIVDPRIADDGGTNRQDHW